MTLFRPVGIEELALIFDSGIKNRHATFWRQYDFSERGVTNVQRDDLIAKIEKRWEIAEIPFKLPRLTQPGFEIS